MDHWRAPYLGLRDIPAGLNEFELTTFFSYSAAELEVIRSLRKPLHRFGLAMHMGFIRMSGRTLDAVDRIPKALWSHLGNQLGIDPPEMGTLRSLYIDRMRTLSEHQQLAYRTLGFQQMTEHQRRYVVRWLRETLNGRSDQTSLLPEVKRWFYDHRILQIAPRELKSLIATAQRDHEARLLKALEHAYGQQKLQEWELALSTKTDDGTPLQSWLWAAPLKQSTVQITQFFDKVDHLRTMGVTDHWPATVNDAAVRHYARRCAHRAPSVSKRITSTRRSLEVACFLRYALCTSSDQLLLMLRRWIRKMANDAARESTPNYADAQAKLQDFAQSVRKLAKEEELSHADLKSKLVELATAALTDPKVSRSALARAYLIEHPAQSRALLGRVLTLPLAAQGDHPVIQALDVLRNTYANRATSLITIPTIKLGNRWQKVIAGVDRQKALSAFEWATLFALRVALRNGSVYLGHSFVFRSQATLFIVKEDWQKSRDMYYSQLGLSKDPKETLEPLAEHLKKRLQDFAAAASSGQIQVDADGIHQARKVASPKEVRVIALRRALMEGRPLGQLPEIVLEIDSAVRFSWMLLGREPNSRRELLMVYAAVFAHGTSMSASDVSRMIPELPVEAVRQTMKRLSDERRLRQASDAVVQYLHRFEIAKHWGRSDLASSDMMSLETERAIWQSRADPRRKTASIGIYTHVRDGWGIVYDQPIVLNERQAGVAIEGVVRQSAVEDVGQLAVDTHGYTDFAMAVAKLLGFDLCPRLADIKHRKLYALKGYTVPEALETVMACTLEFSVMEGVFDEMVRIAASIRSGQCSAVQALTRFGSAARGQSVYDGGVQFGQMLCTIFKVDYLLNPAFSSEIRHALNRGESSHTLQHAIHSGKIPAALSKRTESLAAVSSALSLLSNSVMAWNASHMQTAWEGIKEAGGEPGTEDLRRIAPTNIEGINLRGTFDFPVEKFAQRILPSSVDVRDLSRRRIA
nr:Tn3 family transposase [Rhodoferax sp.]